MSSLDFRMPAPRLPDLSVRPDAIFSIMARPNQAAQGMERGADMESRLNSAAQADAIRGYDFGQRVTQDKVLSDLVMQDPVQQGAANLGQIQPRLSNLSDMDPERVMRNMQSQAPDAAAPRPPVATSMLGDSPNAETAVGHAMDKGLAPNLVLSMIDAESGGNPDAVSSKGATGLMQVMPGTAQDLGYSPDEMRDPDKNIEAGTRYFSQLQQKYGDTATALVAYNMGPGATDKWLAAGADPDKLPAETKAYVQKVMAKAEGAQQGAENLAQVQPTAARMANRVPAQEAQPQQQQPQAEQPWQMYHRRAQALAAAGQGRAAAEMEDKAVTMQREISMDVLKNYDKSPELGEALAQQVGVQIPEALKQSAPLRKGAIIAHDQLKYEDPSQIAQAAALIAQNVPLDQVAKQIGPAKAKPVAEAFTIAPIKDALGNDIGYRKINTKTGQLEESRSSDAGEGTPGKLSKEAIEMLAEQMLSGDTSAITHMGYGKIAAANRAALQEEVSRQAKARGMGGSDVAAVNAEFFGTKQGERTLGGRIANIGMAVNEAKMMIPLALDASEKVDRTQFPTLNAALLAAERGTGGEEVVRFGVATNSLINAYARAINPGGVSTVHDKEHARELLSTAWAKGQYSAAVKQMMVEMDAAQKSPGAVRQEMREAITGKPAEAAPAAKPAAKADDKLSIPPSPAERRAAPLALPPANERIAGETKTPDGKYVWNGRGWVEAQ